MGRGKRSRQGIVVGLSLFVIGAILLICAQPIFSYTREELQQVPRSEAIMNYSFNVHQSQDKIVQVQLSIGQTLNILATSNDIFNFSIANFTGTDHVIQSDEPDLTYLSLDNTSSINTTWSPTSRTAQPGNYYLIFLARNASPDYPTQIYANVTKTWTDLRIIQVPAADRRPIINPNFAYLGTGIVVLGAAVLLVTIRAAKGKRRIVTQKSSSTGFF
jgi:hypothetical protein